MRSCVVSMTTLLCLMKFKVIFGHVKTFVMTNSSGKLWSRKSKQNMAVAIRFSNWPFAIWFWKLRGSWILKRFTRKGCLIPSKSIQLIALRKAFDSTRASFARPFLKTWNTEGHTAFCLSFQDYCARKRHVQFFCGFILHKLFFNLWRCNFGRGITVISTVASCLVSFDFLDFTLNFFESCWGTVHVFSWF